MSLYKKFRKRMEDEMRHHFDGHDAVNVWMDVIQIMGESLFNETLAPYMVVEEGHWENAEQAFYRFHKSFRQVDVFDGRFARVIDVPVLDENGKQVRRQTEKVIDEHIDSSLESLIWTLVHLDKSGAFYKAFEFYWNLNQKEVPTLEFVYEKIDDWSDKYNGLVGVRVEGTDKYLTEKEFKKLYPDSNHIWWNINNGMEAVANNRPLTRQQSRNGGPGTRPIYQNSREMDEIISWESRNDMPFKFIEKVTIVPAAKLNKG